MSENLLCSIVEIYNATVSNKLTLTMSESAAIVLAHIFDVGGSLAIQTAMVRTMQWISREREVRTLTTFPLRFTANSLFFRYLVVAAQTETGFHFEMFVSDKK
jgi:hypothetical protein